MCSDTLPVELPWDLKEFSEKPPLCTGNQKTPPQTQIRHQEQFKPFPIPFIIEKEAVLIDKNGLIAGFILPDILPPPMLVSCNAFCLLPAEMCIGLL